MVDKQTIDMINRVLFQEPLTVKRVRTVPKSSAIPESARVSQRARSVCGSAKKSNGDNKAPPRPSSAKLSSKKAVSEKALS